MPRDHLSRLTAFSGIKSAFKHGYDKRALTQDILAGLTVGIIAIPLAMALAIASGVPPQYGLYTAIIAGFIIPLTGGSRYSVSGPTAAFVVILHPVAEAYGLSGLLIASLLAGAMLILMAVARLGRLIEYVPLPVTLGFTSGIAVVIAVLQINDFFGLHLTDLPESFPHKILTIISGLPGFNFGELLIASTTFAIILGWKRLKLPIPGHLPAVVAGLGMAAVLTALGLEVDTIGSRFSYILNDGTRGFGIPPVLPEFQFPWLRQGPDGLPVDWSFSKLVQLLPAALSIAMLGAIESLLCAVVLDGMSGQRHQPNGELLGQGLGNLVAPWFGGIVATAALARSATNYRSGANSPIAAMTHSVVILIALLLLAPWFSYIPMASMAALLLMVAWNMSEADKVIGLLRKSPRGDVLVLIVCFSLTVFVDMVVAIGTGIVLSSLLFMREIASMTKVTNISANPKHLPEPLNESWGVYKINGPLFFAAAERIFAELESVTEDRISGIILYMDGVTILDAGGLEGLKQFIKVTRKRQQMLIIADLQFQPLKSIARSGIKPEPETLQFSATLSEGILLARNHVAI